jgi:YVTN family beta-propeller protein
VISHSRRTLATLATLAGLAVLAVLAVTGGPASAAGTAPAGVQHRTDRGEFAPRVYVISPSSSPDSITTPSTISVYDPNTYEVVKRVPAAGFKPHKFYLIPGRNLAYITHFGGPGTPQAIEVFDVLRNEVVGTIPTGGDGPRHLAFSPDYRYGYTANLEGGSISVIDVAAGKTVRTIPTGNKPNYAKYFQTRVGPRIFVVNFGEDTMTVLDARTYEQIGTVRVGNGPYNLVATPDRRFVITANARDNTVSFVDAVTLQVRHTVSIGGVHQPLPNNIQRLNPRISPEGRWLWVGNQDASVMSIIDLRTHKLATQIPAGLGADIAFFPKSGPAKGYALITGRYDHSVVVAKLNGQRPPTFVKEIRLAASGAHFITFDEEYERGYVSQRPGGAFSVLDLASLTAVKDSVPVGPSPEQASYVWFEDGVAKYHDNN